MPATADRPEQADRKAPQLGRLRGVDLFAAGEHRGKKYSVDDLCEMVRNFRKYQAGQRPLMRIPAVLGHSEDQKYLEQEGLPACGWLSRLYIGNDEHLRGDFEDIHPRAFPLLDNKSYRTVSAEIYDEPPTGIPGKGMMVRRIAFLGGDIPEVKGLEELPPVEKYAEKSPKHAPRFLTPPTTIRFNRVAERANQPGTYFVFSEVSPMNRDEMMKKLAEGGWDEEHLKGLNDKQMAETCRMHDEMNKPDEDDHEDHDEPSDEEVGKMAEEDRDEAAKKYASKAYSAFARKFAGHAPAKGSDGWKAMWANSPGGEDDHDTRSNHHKLDEEGAGGGQQPTKITETRHFSERDIRRMVADGIKKGLTTHASEVKAKLSKLDKFAEDRLAAEKKATVKARLDTLVGKGLVLVAEREGLERIADGLDATTVRKFSERGKTVARTPFDDFFATLEGRPQLQRFGEQVRSGSGKAGSAEEETAKVQRFAESNADFAHALKAAGRTPEDHVNAFIEAKKKNPRLTAAQYGVPADVA